MNTLIPLVFLVMASVPGRIKYAHMRMRKKLERHLTTRMRIGNSYTARAHSYVTQCSHDLLSGCAATLITTQERNSCIDYAQ